MVETELCLLDFRPDQLVRILNDESLSSALTEYDESSVLEHVDELVNLYEAPTTGLILTDVALQDIRNEWTVKITENLAEDLKKFVDQSPSPSSKLLT